MIVAGSGEGGGSGSEGREWWQKPVFGRDVVQVSAGDATLLEPGFG